LFKVDIETFKNAERWLYLNDYRQELDKKIIEYYGNKIDTVLIHDVNKHKINIKN